MSTVNISEIQGLVTTPAMQNAVTEMIDMGVSPGSPTRFIRSYFGMTAAIEHQKQIMRNPEQITLVKQRSGASDNEGKTRVVPDNNTPEGIYVQNDVGFYLTRAISAQDLIREVSYDSGRPEILSAPQAAQKALAKMARMINETYDLAEFFTLKHGYVPDISAINKNPAANTVAYRKYNYLSLWNKARPAGAGYALAEGFDINVKPAGALKKFGRDAVASLKKKAAESHMFIREGALVLCGREAFYDVIDSEDMSAEKGVANIEMMKLALRAVQLDSFNQTQSEEMMNVRYENVDYVYYPMGVSTDSGLVEPMGSRESLVLPLMGSIVERVNFFTESVDGNAYGTPNHVTWTSITEDRESMIVGIRGKAVPANKVPEVAVLGKFKA